MIRRSSRSREVFISEKRLNKLVSICHSYPRSACFSKKIHINIAHHKFKQVEIFLGGKAGRLVPNWKYLDGKSPLVQGT